MEKHYLSADELLTAVKYGSTELPQRGGIKDYAPDGSWLQAKKIDVFHRELAEVLDEQRVKKLGGTAVGEWRPEKKEVLVHSTPGKFWNQVGHTENQLKWLYPEEALFLLDQGLMEIKHGGIPLTIQEAYSTVLGPLFPIERYQVYAHLRRLGYIVQRHIPVMIPTKYERQLRIDQHETKLPKKSRKKRGKQKAIEGEALWNNDYFCDSEQPQKKRPKQTVSADHSGVNSGNCLFENSQMDHDLEHSGSGNAGRGFYKCEPTPVRKRTSSPKKKYLHWDSLSLEFPDLSVLSLQDPAAINIPVPQNRFLPCEISRESGNFTLKLDQLRTNLACDASVQNCDQKFSINTKWWSIRASDWGEYKHHLEVQSDRDLLKSSPVGVLWRENDVQPLVSPLDGKNTESILKKLKIIENVNLTHDVVIPNIKTPTGDLEIVYDVYLPNAKFRKTDPGLPDHRIAVARQQEQPPTLCEIACLSRQCVDGVPLHWAVNDEGSLAFYRFVDVDIAPDINMG